MQYIGVQPEEQGPLSQDGSGSWGFPLVAVSVRAVIFHRASARGPARRGIRWHNSGNMTFIKPCQLYWDAFSSAAVDARGTWAVGALQKSVWISQEACVKVARALPPPSLTCALTMETFSPGVRGGLSFTKKKKKRKRRRKTALCFLYHHGTTGNTLTSVSLLTALYLLWSVFDCYGVDTWSHLLTMAAKNTREPQHVRERERVLGPDGWAELVRSLQDSP